MGVDLATLGLNIAGVLAPGEQAKTAMNALCGGLIGGKSGVDKNAYFDRTLQAMLSQREGQRSSLRMQLLTGLEQSPKTYPLMQAAADLEAYYAAGTLAGAVTAITLQAAAAQAVATANLAARLPTAQEVQARLKREHFEAQLAAPPRPGRGQPAGQRHPDGMYTVTVVWDDGGDAVSSDELDAFERQPSAEEQVLFQRGGLANAPGLGALSKHFESNGKPGAIGFDTAGGFSYRAHQIAAKTGTLKRFLDFLGQRFAGMAASLQLAGGASAGLAGSEAFKGAWRALAHSDPQFQEAQHGFIQATHYHPFMVKLKAGLGLDVAARSSALQDVAWSVAVQHGPGNKVFSNALSGQPLASLGEAALIKAIYAERSNLMRYFPRSTPQVRTSLAARFHEADRLALAMLARHGWGLFNRGEPPHRQTPPFSHRHGASEPGECGTALIPRPVGLSAPCRTCLPAPACPFNWPCSWPWLCRACGCSTCRRPPRCSTNCWPWLALGRCWPCWARNGVFLVGMPARPRPCCGCWPCRPWPAWPAWC
jgi:hypothetical protein